MMDYESALWLVEALQLLHDIFDDNEKVAYWLTVENPHLGGITPLLLFSLGRGHKVLKFIRAAKEEQGLL